MLWCGSNTLSHKRYGRDKGSGWNRQRFVVINPRLTPGFSGYVLNRGAPSVSLSELLRYKNPYNSRNEATEREEIFVFFRCSFYTVTRDYPQKLVTLKDNSSCRKVSR